MVRRPAAVNDWPLFGPLATRNSRVLVDSGEQICLDQTRDLDIEGNAAFLGAFAHYSNPAGTDIDVGDIEGE